MVKVPVGSSPLFSHVRPPFKEEYKFDPTLAWRNICPSSVCPPIIILFPLSGGLKSFIKVTSLLDAFKE